jgi:hypothetical protein
MSKTLRTRSPKVVAAVEDVSLPIIVHRRPSRDDSHPAMPQVLRGALCSVPSAYLVGLKRIELCPRGSSIGQPFAKYRSDEQCIFLYSLPMTWEWSAADELFLREVQRFGAEVSTLGTVASIHWRNIASRCCWYVLSVLAHELGHHYRYRDRFRKRTTSRANEEINAHLHAWRIEASVRTRQHTARVS